MAVTWTVDIGIENGVVQGVSALSQALHELYIDHNDQALLNALL